MTAYDAAPALPSLRSGQVTSALIALLVGLGSLGQLGWALDAYGSSFFTMVFDSDLWEYAATAALHHLLVEGAWILGATLVVPAVVALANRSPAALAFTSPMGWLIIAAYLTALGLWADDLSSNGVEFGDAYHWYFLEPATPLYGIAWTLLPVGVGAMFLVRMLGRAPAAAGSTADTAVAGAKPEQDTSVAIMPSATTPTFYVWAEEAEHGPYTQEQLRHYAGAGLIIESSYVRSGDGLWTSALYVPGLDFTSTAGGHPTPGQRPHS